MNVEQKHQSGPILAFDTSTASMAAAIVQGNEVVVEIQSLAERNHSVHIITHIKQLLESSGIADEKLEAVAVGNGPGSYTGMRIAVAAAKTLAWVWNKPLVAVSSLEALGYGAWHRGTGMEMGAAAMVEGEHWVFPIMDARRGQVYSSAFAISNERNWSRWADDGVRLMNDWVDYIAKQLANPDKDKVSCVWLVGDLSIHEAEAERLQQLGQAAGVEVRLYPFVQEGQWIAHLGRYRLQAGLIEDHHTLIPNYTQLTEAEVNLKAKQAGEAKA